MCVCTYLTNCPLGTYTTAVHSSHCNSVMGYHLCFPLLVVFYSDLSHWHFLSVLPSKRSIPWNAGPSGKLRHKPENNVAVAAQGAKFSMPGHGPLCR